jgi:ankyrin repeat protein
MAAASPSQEEIDQFVGNAHGNFTVVKQLLAKYSTIVNLNATRNETAVQAATQTGQVQIVNYLLDYGADYDICTASMLGSVDCLGYFLHEDPDLVDTRGAHGIPLLYFPVSHVREAVAEYLLQLGADVNAASPEGITSLHGAVMFNQPGMAQWLLGHGANPNPEYEGKSPLAMAREKNQAELVELLCSYGGRQ